MFPLWRVHEFRQHTTKAYSTMQKVLAVIKHVQLYYMLARGKGLRGGGGGGGGGGGREELR